MNFKLYSTGKKIPGKVSADFLSEDVGIFESLRSYGDQIFRLDAHLKRFAESAKTSGFPQKIDQKSLQRELLKALRSFRSETQQPAADLFLRLMLWKNEIYVMVGHRIHSRTLYQQGVHLQTSPVRRTLANAMPAQVKTSAYQNAVLATLEPNPSESYEWVFLDAEGYVTEVRIGNLFIVVGASRTSPQLLTPPETGILNGVTRRVVIESGLQLQLKTRESPLTRHEIYNADEAFLTNTSWEILPIASLDGRKIGRKIPGPVTVRLHQKFKQIIRKECP